MAKVIMVQGTMSGAGKSLLVAGLCRLFKRDGYRAAPFKSQNMALNSFVTREGLEMGRAQVMQAEAAGIEPSVCMNPILLKPTGHTCSQVIVNGRVVGNMGAREYFSYKRGLLPEIRQAFLKLEKMADIIVIEGAGSPAEINLRENDIVNMGLAELVDAPVLLVGDIDRGGVFAQLLGTLLLLAEEERKRVKGLVINKFRGDKSLLDPGIEILERRGGIPVIGVVPYMELALEDEDSLTARFERREEGAVDLAVIRYPRISNFTDFNVFEQIPGVSVRYVDSAARLGSPDMIFLPGSKNTMADLIWMRGNGLERAVTKAARIVPVCGICGGYQMLGEEIADPEGVEAGGAVKGMGLLPVRTVLQGEKICRQVSGTVNPVEGIFDALSGFRFEGYEIHAGRTLCTGCADAEDRGSNPEDTAVFISGENKNIYGTYVHGVFDREGMAMALVNALAHRTGIFAGGSAGAHVIAGSSRDVPVPAERTIVRDSRGLPVPAERTIVRGGRGLPVPAECAIVRDSRGLPVPAERTIVRDSRGLPVPAERTIVRGGGGLPVPAECVIADAEGSVPETGGSGFADVAGSALEFGKGGFAGFGGTDTVCMDYRAFKESQYDKLADTLSAYLNMEEIYGILREARLR